MSKNIVVALAMSAVLLVSLVGCNNKNEPSGETSKKPESSQVERTNKMKEINTLSDILQMDIENTSATYPALQTGFKSPPKSFLQAFENLSFDAGIEIVSNRFFQVGNYVLFVGNESNRGRGYIKIWDGKKVETLFLSNRPLFNELTVKDHETLIIAIEGGMDGSTVSADLYELSITTGEISSLGRTNYAGSTSRTYKFIDDDLYVIEALERGLEGPRLFNISRVLDTNENEVLIEDLYAPRFYGDFLYYKQGTVIYRKTLASDGEAEEVVTTEDFGSFEISGDVLMFYKNVQATAKTEIILYDLKTKEEKKFEDLSFDVSAFYQMDELFYKEGTEIYHLVGDRFVKVAEGVGDVLSIAMFKNGVFYQTMELSGEWVELHQFVQKGNDGVYKEEEEV